MTDEELAAVEAEWADYRASQTERTSFGAEMVPVAVDLLDHKLAQVFAEVQRLRGENDRQERRLAMEKLHRESSVRRRENLERKVIGWREAAEEARSECAALTAKAEAARQGLAENLTEYEQVISSFGPSKTMSREEEEHRDLARAETAEARNCLAIFDAAMGSGMPHTPAQEADPALIARNANVSTYGAVFFDYSPYVCVRTGCGHFTDLHAPGCGVCDCTILLRQSSAMPIPPAEAAADGLAAAERTGVREPHTRPQGSSDG